MIMLQASPDINETEQGQKLERTVSVSNEKDEDEHIETRTQESEKATDDPEVSFFKVVKLNAPEWRSITAACVCSVISGFAMPLLGIIVEDFMKVLSNPDIDAAMAEVRTLAFIFLGVGVFSGTTKFVMVFMYGVAGEYLTARLRKQVFEKILQQEIRFYDDKNNSTGALYARLSGEAAAGGINA